MKKMLLLLDNNTESEQLLDVISHNFDEERCRFFGLFVEQLADEDLLQPFDGQAPIALQYSYQDILDKIITTSQEQKAGNTSVFVDKCMAVGLVPKVYPNKFDIEQRLAMECRFADLLALNEQKLEQLNDRADNFFSLSRTIIKASCPVLLVGRGFRQSLGKVAIVFDGTEACINGIKQFLSSFKDALSISQLYVLLSDSREVSEQESRLIEYLKLKNKPLGLMRLPGPLHKEVGHFMAQHREMLLVASGDRAQWMRLLYRPEPLLQEMRYKNALLLV